MNRRVSTALLTLALLLACIWVLPAAADSNVRIVRLSYMDGDVQIDRRTGQGFENAILNMPIVQGTRLWTRGSDSLAEVEFEDGSTIRLAPDTQVDFEELSLQASGTKVNLVDIQDGMAYFNVKKGGEDFLVTANNREFEAARNSHFRVDVTKADVEVAVFKGDVHLRSEANNIAVARGETLTLDLTDSGRYNLINEVPTDSLDSWDKEREQYRDQYASAQSYNNGGYNNSYGYNYNSVYNSPFAYGYSDLNYYGNFFYVPSYGYMWRPNSLGPGWDPYMQGAWVWYPGWGYTWVSNYPWGWAPYRYGQWVYVPQYGWCWAPGNRWNSWNVTPRILNPPSSWTPPHPPAQNNGGGKGIGSGGHPIVVVGNGGGKGIGSGGGKVWTSDAKPANPGTRHAIVMPGNANGDARAVSPGKTNGGNGAKGSGGSQVTRGNSDETDVPLQSKSGIVIKPSPAEPQRHNPDLDTGKGTGKTGTNSKPAPSSPAAPIKSPPATPSNPPTIKSAPPSPAKPVAPPPSPAAPAHSGGSGPTASHMSAAPSPGPAISSAGSSWSSGGGHAMSAGGSHGGGSHR